MLRIRLRRMGAKKQPKYRLVVAESSSPRDGRFVEIVGNYDPTTNPPTLNVDAERTRYWLEKGARPSESVTKLLHQASVTES
ncbi:MAG: 30S ribosomal protein S16 [Chloroflexi bacterium]|nr:30S ribosomal protein S16 [Chloroflexota bacterium]